MKKIFKSFGILVLLISMVLFLDIGCVFKYVTGIPCPGCGTTRACLQFLEGHPVDAFYWHPLFWLTVILLVVATLTGGRMFRSNRRNHTIFGIFAVMYLTVYLVRMILLFPDTPPMDFNKEALLWKALDWLQNWVVTKGFF